MRRIKDFSLGNHGLRIAPEKRGRRLAEWLNTEHRHRVSKRLVQAVLHIQELIQVREQMPAEVPGTFKVPREWKTRYLRLSAQVQADLNALPRKYYVGGVRPTPAGPYVNISTFHRIPRAPFATSLGIARAVSDLLALNEDLCLDRLRRCGWCGKWFYARKSHGRFCSSHCQQDHYKLSPKWREYRRIYMRRYREQTS